MLSDSHFDLQVEDLSLETAFGNVVGASGRIHLEPALPPQTPRPQRLSFARLESLLKKPGLRDKDAMNLRFALGKLCDDAGRFDDAFAHYGVARGLRIARKHLAWYGEALGAREGFRARINAETEPARVRAAIGALFDAAGAAAAA